MNFKGISLKPYSTRQGVTPSERSQLETFLKQPFSQLTVT